MRSVKNSLKLNVKPTDHEIEKMRQRTGSFMKSHGVSDCAVHAQFRIIRELIKIGIKYGNFLFADIELTVNVQVDKNTIMAEINSPIKESNFERFKELDKIIQFIRGYHDPFEAFMITQKKASINYPQGDSNALELSKLAYEEKVILDFFISEDNILQISATRRLEGNNCNAM
jgi:hypothetical protein